jgi:hypothetical protein
LPSLVRNRPVAMRDGEGKRGPSGFAVAADMLSRMSATRAVLHIARHPWS